MTAHLVTVLVVSTGSWMMFAGLAALGLGVLILLLLSVPRERTLTTEERVVQYANRAGTGAPAQTAVAPVSTRPEESALESAKTAAASVLKRSSGLESRIAQRLEGAGSALAPGGVAAAATPRSSSACRSSASPSAGGAWSSG